MATITWNHLTLVATETDASSYNTPSVSPAADALIVVAVVHRAGATINDAVVSGLGLTWTEEETNTFYDPGSGSRYRMSVWTAVTPSSSPPSGAITVAFGGQTQSNVVIFVTEATWDGGGAPGVVQSAQAAAGSGVTSLTVTLASAIADTGNSVYAAFGRNVSEACTPGSGFDEWYEQGLFTLLGYAEIDVAGADTTADCSWSTSSRAGGIALEIGTAASAVEKSGSDSATLADASALSATLALSDAGTLSELVSGRELVLTDAGVFTDASALAAAIAAADSATLLEALLIGLEATDAGTLSELVSGREISLADLATLSEAIGSREFSVADQALLSELASVLLPGAAIRLRIEDAAAVLLAIADRLKTLLELSDAASAELDVSDPGE